MLAKTLLITGVSANGISLETCRRILEVQKAARQPIAWTFVLAQRDPDSPRARQALMTLQRISDAKVHSYSCDLCELQSVRLFCKSVKNDHPSLDAVILNAATISNTYATTVDGNELLHQVNHLGHFLLLHLLREIIRERVIFVGSSLHKKADAERTLATLQSGKDGYRGLDRYAQSKLLDAYCLSHWHKIFHERDVSVVLVSPGFVPSTELSRDNGIFARFAMSWIISYLPFARTRVQAGDTIAAVAIADELRHLSNVYLSPDLKEEKMHQDVYDSPENADKVWMWSKDRTGIVQD